MFFRVLFWGAAVERSNAHSLHAGTHPVHVAVLSLLPSPPSCALPVPLDVCRYCGNLGLTVQKRSGAAAARNTLPSLS